MPNDPGTRTTRQLVEAVHLQAGQSRIRLRRVHPLLLRLLVPFARPFMKPPAQGAATSIHLASAAGLDQVTGRFFADSQPKRSGQRSYDETAAARR